MKYVMVDHQIKQLLQRNKLKSSEHKLEKHIQPSSLDLPLGTIAYNVKRSYAPVGITVKESLKNNVIEKIDLTKPAVLRKHNTYLVPTIKVNLPKGVYAKSSPKSSIGRIDVFVRTLVDEIGLYDVIPEDFSGVIWLEITPQSFNIKAKSGVPLTQLQFLTNELHTEQSDYKNKITNNRTHYPFIDNDCELVSIHVDNSRNTGYVAKETNEVVDLSSRTLDPNKFFYPLTEVEDRGILLRKGHFYIMRTHEKIFIPKTLSGEMLPYTNMFGELRVHYAGYFDPGFGLDNSENKLGNYGVLEIRPFENIKVKNRQPVCLMKKFQNSAIPDKIYGYSGNNYTLQEKVRLAKFFSD